MENYLGKMVICPNGHLGYVEIENADEVGVQFDNKMDLTYFKKNDVELATEFSHRMQEFFDNFWLNLQVYVWEPVRDWFYNIRWFFKNVHRFRKDLWKYRDWDYEYCVGPFVTALQGLHDCLKYEGHEVAVMRDKKVAAIEELIRLLQYNPEDDDELFTKYVKHDLDFRKTYTDAEHEQFRNEYNAYRDAVAKADRKRIDRIARLLKGQTDKELDITEEKEHIKTADPERYAELEKDGFYSLFEDKFDGTGYQGWWD